MDELVAQFVGITDSTESKARQYLQITDNNLEQAIELFFTSGGTDLFDAAPPTTTNPPPATRTQREVIELDSDEDDENDTESRTRASAPAAASALESDEEMARRLQEEMYGAGNTGSGMDAEGYRAPIARTRETLVGPDSYDLDNPADMQAAMREQMYARQQARMYWLAQ